MIEELTEREKEIYNAIVIDGVFSYKDLAEKFCLSEYTIRTHFVNIYQKTYCHTKAELIWLHYSKILKRIKETKPELYKEFLKNIEKLEDIK